MVPPSDPAKLETDSTTRLFLAPQRGWHRHELSDGSGGQVLAVSDGVTEWRPTVTGAFTVDDADPDRAPAAYLFDPSWLLDYHWDTAVEEVRDGREVIAFRARWSASVSAARSDEGLAVSKGLRLDPPEDVCVLVDAEFGFLHRLTGFLDGDPYEVQELSDVEMEPVRDVSFFRIDRSKFQVLDPPPQHSLPLFDFVSDHLESPSATWSDLGARASDLRADLERRMGRLPVHHLRSWSDLDELQRLERDHLLRLARGSSLSDEDYQALSSLWFDRFDEELHDVVERLRIVQCARLARVHRRWQRLSRYHLGGLYWNTLGPGGQTWFADYLPVRRYLFRLRWRL